jgi:uncharacterized HAD superfamily protein
MSNRLPRLAFDVDGVFANFQQGFLDLVNARFGTTITTDQWTQYLDIIGPNAACPIFTKEQWDYGWEKLKITPFFWANLKPFPNVDWDQLELDMATFQFNGYFITKRCDLNTQELGDSNALTRIFFEKYGIENATAIISCLGKNRIALLKELAVDAYIDDWGEQFLEAREAGINAFLLNQPFNQHVDTPYRVYSIQEYVDRAMGRPSLASLRMLPVTDGKVVSIANV